MFVLPHRIKVPGFPALSFTKLNMLSQNQMIGSTVVLKSLAQAWSLIFEHTNKRDEPKAPF